MPVRDGDRDLSADDESGPVRLDPRAPLVLDTRELGRRPGSERRVSLTAPAPADLGIEVLRVPEGSPVEFDIRLEAVVEGVLVTGTAQAVLGGECVRCLEEISREITADFQELFVYDDDGSAGEETEDGETSRLEGDLVDLEPLLRDSVVLALPFQPLCQDDCPGLCTECGARLADDPDHRHEEAVDPRWAALQELASGEAAAHDPANKQQHPARPRAPGNRSQSAARTEE
jgi:uncharacterized protein